MSRYHELKTKKAKKEYIQELLARHDKVGMHAVGRALMCLYDRQTYSEQRTDSTRIFNDIGFSAADAEMGSSMARYYRKMNFLTAKQVAWWQRQHGNTSTSRIGKYWEQLIDEASQ